MRVTEYQLACLIYSRLYHKGTIGSIISFGMSHDSKNSIVFHQRAIIESMSALYPHNDQSSGNNATAGIC